MNSASSSPRLRSIVALLAVAATLALAACSDTAEPSRDNTAPDVCVELSISTGLWWQTARVMVTDFAADPLCTADDTTDRHELIARWDYEDDGVWDTDWQPLRYADCFVPDPLPTDMWRLRLAVRDNAGNTRTIVEERAIPDWLPAGPELSMGNIETFEETHPETGALMMYYARTIVWGWNLPTWDAVACELWVDDALVLREDVPPLETVNRECRFDDGECVRTFGAELVDYLTPGRHEIRFVIDVDGHLVEMDEADNVKVMTVDIGVPAARSAAGGGS